MITSVVWWYCDIKHCDAVRYTSTLCLTCTTPNCRQGYNVAGFSKDGYDKDGFDRLGFNKDGFNRWAAASSSVWIYSCRPALLHCSCTVPALVTLQALLTARQGPMMTRKQLILEALLESPCNGSSARLPGWATMMTEVQHGS